MTGKVLRLKRMDKPDIMVMRYSGVSSIEDDQSCSSFVFVGSVVAVTFEMIIATSVKTNILRLLCP